MMPSRCLSAAGKQKMLHILVISYDIAQVCQIMQETTGAQVSGFVVLQVVALTVQMVAVTQQAPPEYSPKHALPCRCLRGCCPSAAQQEQGVGVRCSVVQPPRAFQGLVRVSTHTRTGTWRRKGAP
jgi:hypothetical protein